MPVEEVHGNLDAILSQSRNKLVVVDFFAQWFVTRAAPGVPSDPHSRPRTGGQVWAVPRDGARV